MIKERLKSEIENATSKMLPSSEIMYKGKRVLNPVMHAFANDEDNIQRFCCIRGYTIKGG